MDKKAVDATNWMHENMVFSDYIDEKTVETFPIYVQGYIKEYWKPENKGNTKVYYPPELKAPVLKRCTCSEKLVPQINTNNMDEANRKIMECFENESIEAGIKSMFEDEHTGKKLTYSEMRDRYG
jgi:hypothetical protein